MDNEKVQVELTAQELEELQAFRREQAEKQEAERRQQEREAYRKMSEDLVDEVMPDLIALNRQIRLVKKSVYDAFEAIIESKAELFGIKETQRSHNFMNRAGTCRVVLGYHKKDLWDDTAEAGVELVRQYISSLGATEEARELSEMLIDLLSKDANGNLKADKVLMLDRYATKSRNSQLLEAVAIIKEAYRPEKSKQYIKAEVKDATGMWRNIPLSVTDVSLVLEETHLKKQDECVEQTNQE